MSLILKLQKMWSRIIGTGCIKESIFCTAFSKYQLDALMICNSMSFLIVFQSYNDNKRLVHWSLVCVWTDFCRKGSNLKLLDH